MVRVISNLVLAEFSPVFAFFIAGQFFSFFVATGVLVLFTAIAFFVAWRRDRHVPVLPLLSVLFVIVAGLFTLIYNSPNALILSDSLYYFLIAGLIGVGLLNNQLVLKRFFKRFFAMSDTGWRVLSTRLIILCIIAGILNEIVRLNMSADFWVNYKFAKVILITLFGFYQFTIARKYRIVSESNEWGVRTGRKKLFRKDIIARTKRRLKKVHV